MHQRHCSTADQHMHLASQMIAHQGDYGIVSNLSRKHNISRQSLYVWRDIGKRCMESVFCLKNRKAEQKASIARNVLTLFTRGHASREGIQHCLEEMLGEHVSLGTISAIIHEAGQRAQEWLAQQMPEGMRDLAIDEQYGSQRGQAYLNIVDALTGFVYASVPPVAVDGESWSILFLYMKDQGLQWRVAVSDGGKAIQDAVQEVTPEIIHQRDVWHVLHECQKVQKRVDRSLHLLQEQTPVVERQAKRVALGYKPRGKKPKTDVVAHAKDVEQMEYVATSLHYLSAELQRLLEIVVLTDQGILASQARQEELNTLLELFAELCEATSQSLKKEIEKLVRHMQLALPGLIAFCPALDAVQHQAYDQLGVAAVHLIGWAWQRRAILGPKRDQLVAAFPPSWQVEVAALLGAWDEAVRSSSAVENWHSILRPFIAVHRHLTASMLAILAVWHNHRVASRGVHKGQSPLIRSGLAKEPTDWLDALGYPSASLVPQQASHLGDTVEPKTESTAA
jgi:hypothetical protein